VPAPAVLAVDTSGRAGAVTAAGAFLRMLWRQVRPLLDQEEVEAAHREIAEALLTIQTVRFDGFGELDRSAGVTRLAAALGLRRRLLP